MNALGEKIKNARKLKGLGLRELGIKIGFSHSQLSKVERGLSNPSNSLLKKIADELELNMEDLLLLIDPNLTTLNYTENLLNSPFEEMEGEYALIRYQTMVRDNFTCQACGQTAPISPLEIASIIPINMGGKLTLENSITVCPNCQKGRDFLIRNNGLIDDIFVKRFNINLNEYSDLEEE